jgi:hypothetical protein
MIGTDKGSLLPQIFPELLEAGIVLVAYDSEEARFTR